MIRAFSIPPASNDVLSSVVDFDAESQISFQAPAVKSVAACRQTRGDDARGGNNVHYVNEC